MIKSVLAVLSVSVVCLAGYIAWDVLSKPRPVGTESIVAKEAPAVKRAPRVKVMVKKPVETIQGDAKKNLKLPDEVQGNKDKQVVAATQAPASLRPTTTSTVIDTETGTVTTYTKQDPYPWFAVETRGNIGLAYGYKYSHVMHSSEPVGRLNLGYDVVRIKAFTVGVQATVDSDSTAFAGVGVTYRW